jgi:Zn ribbon nucleic-acid-binding protein
MNRQAGSLARASTPEHFGLLERAGRQVRQLMCGMGGHDTLRHFGERRVSLECVNCGHQSPGWQVSGSGLGPDTRQPCAPAKGPAPARAA